MKAMNRGTMDFGQISPISPISMSSKDRTFLDYELFTCSDEHRKYCQEKDHPVGVDITKITLENDLSLYLLDWFAMKLAKYLENASFNSDHLT